jgi:tripartite-type tricarboxylate transporter receptor subunit TctC
MKLPRREFLRLAIGAVAASALPHLAGAQTYPAQPVRLVVGVAAGGSTDILARLMAQWLSDRLGQQFFVENRPGGGTNVATESVVNAAPDGYTLVFAATSSSINASLYQKLSFNFMRDIAPVAGVVRVPNVVVVSNSVPAKTLPEFIAYAKENPGKVNMASAGIGTTPHMSGELFKMMAGVNMVHVPYRGTGPAHADLISGQVQVLFDGMPSCIALVRGGQLRALAVTTSYRSEALPDLPRVADFVPGYEASSWFGIGAPKNTPAPIIEGINREINAALADPKMKAKLADLGGDPLAGSPADFGSLVAAETEKWGKVVKFSGVKAQ